MEKVYQDDDEIEIDLRELLFEMKKKIWFIIAGLLIGAGNYRGLQQIPDYTPV